MRKNEVSIQFRMKESTHQKLKYISKHQLRSLNGQIEFFVQEGIENYEKQYGEIDLKDVEE